MRESPQSLQFPKNHSQPSSILGVVSQLHVRRTPTASPMVWSTLVLRLEFEGRACKGRGLCGASTAI